MHCTAVSRPGDERRATNCSTGSRNCYRIPSLLVHVRTSTAESFLLESPTQLTAWSSTARPTDNSKFQKIRLTKVNWFSTSWTRRHPRTRHTSKCEEKDITHAPWLCTPCAREKGKKTRLGESRCTCKMWLKKFVLWDGFDWKVKARTKLLFLHFSVYLIAWNVHSLIN